MTLLPLAALTLVAAAPEKASMTVQHHATGTFEVTITPEAQASAPEGGLPTGRMAIAKTFSGGMAGRATGTMLTAGTPGAGKVAVYVAIDQFSGSVDGRAGGFVLLHQGMMSSAGPTLSVTIAPDSGTGALKGIAGTLTIEVTGGVHHYDLAYTLSPSASSSRP